MAKYDEMQQHYYDQLNNDMDSMKSWCDSMLGSARSYNNGVVEYTVAVAQCLGALAALKHVLMSMNEKEKVLRRIAQEQKEGA